MIKSEEAIVDCIIACREACNAEFYEAKLSMLIRQGDFLYLRSVSVCKEGSAGYG